MTTVSTVALVLMAIAANPLASVLLKHAAINSGAATLPELPGRVLLLAGGAVLVYMLAFVLYAAVLRSLPVSKAYALITFGAQGTLIAAGAFFFGERLGAGAWAGLALIAVGLVLVFRSASS